MAYSLYVVAVQTSTPEEAASIEEDILRTLRRSGKRPAPCNWVPDQDTVADGLSTDYDDVTIFDLNPSP